mgnify:CR=1 FL=1
MAGTKITADVITDTSITTGKLDNASVTTGKLGNASVTVGKVHDQFTTASALGSSATENVDWDAAQVFTLTPSQSTTLNIVNSTVGLQKALIITGSGNSYTITLNVGGAAGTFNLISGEYDDTAGIKNLINILCVSSTEFWYSISQIAT